MDVARATARDPFRGHSSAWTGSFRPSCHSLSGTAGAIAPRSAAAGGQPPSSASAVVDLVQSLHHHLAHRADELAPAEALLDALSSLADLVARVPGRATVDGAAAVAVEVLRTCGVMLIRGTP